jgi:hypothetical protein
MSIFSDVHLFTDFIPRHLLRAGNTKEHVLDGDIVVLWILLIKDCDLTGIFQGVMRVWIAEFSGIELLSLLAFGKVVPSNTSVAQTTFIALQVPENETLPLFRAPRKPNLSFTN